MTGASLLRDVVSLCITFWLAGVLLGLVFLPKRLGGVTRTWLSLALAPPATVIAAAPGLLTHGMSTATFAGGLVVLAGLAAWRCRRSLHRLRYAARNLRKSTRRLGPVRPVVLLLGALVGWLAVMEPQIAGTPPGYLHNILTSWYYHWITEETMQNGGFPLTSPPGYLHNILTSWYYHWITEETMQNGGFPLTSLEWGGVRPFHLAYTTMISHAAVTARLAGGTTFVLLDYYRLAVAALTLLAAYALWRRFMPTWWAWIAAVLTMTSGQLTHVSSDYQPQTFAFLLVLWSGWLLDEAYARRSPRWAALAGLVSATAFLAHAVVWNTTAPLWLAITLSRLIPHLLSLARKRSSETSAKPAGAPRLWRNVPAMSKVVAACALAFIVSLAGLAFGAGGSAELPYLAGLGGLTGGTGSGEKQPPPASGTRGLDQTWVLQQAQRSGNYTKSVEKGQKSFRAHPFGNVRTRKPYPGVDATSPRTLALFALGFAAVLGSLPSLPPRGRRGVLTAVVYAAGIFGLTYLMVSVYTTYVPQRTGPLRVLPFYVLALAGLLAILGWAISSHLYRILRRITSGRRLRRGHLRRGRLGGRSLAALSVSLVSAVLLASFTPVVAGGATPAAGSSKQGKNSSGGLSPQAYEAYAWMKHNLPPNSRVLANAYTQGSLGLLSGDNGILDGRIPFREYWMNQAISQLLEARAFYANPTANKPPADPDYVLVAKDTNLGTARTFPANLPALRQDPGLRLVKNFKGKGRLLLFKVVKKRK